MPAAAWAVVTRAAAEVGKGVQIIGDLVISCQGAAGVVVEIAVGADIGRLAGRGSVGAAGASGGTGAGAAAAWIAVCHGLHLV